MLFTHNTAKQIVRREFEPIWKTNVFDGAGTKGRRPVRQCAPSPWRRWNKPSAAATERSTERRSSGTRITTRYQSHGLGRWVERSSLWARLSFGTPCSLFGSRHFLSVWLTRPGTWASIPLCTCRIKCSTSSKTTSWWTVWSAALPCCWSAACATHRLPCTRSKAWSGHTTCCSSGQVSAPFAATEHAFVWGILFSFVVFFFPPQPRRRRETP